MSIQFDTGLGISISLRDGARALEESSAGPHSRQFSLSNGDLVSLVRDDTAATNLADIIAWTENMANFYVTEFGAVEEMQGSVTGTGKQGFAYSVAFRDAEDVPRRATLIGTLLGDGIFAGITLLTVNAGQPLDVALVQELVDGLEPTS